MRKAAVLLLFCSTCGERPQPPEGAKAPVGAASAATDPAAPAARIGKDVITMGEVDRMIIGALRRADFDHQKQVYQHRVNALDQIIVERLFAAKAKAKNQALEDFLKAEIEAKVPEASEAEAQQFFEQNQQQMGGAPFQDLKARIIAHLTSQRRGQAFEKYVGDARKAANVEVVLAEPEQPRVEVATIGPSKGPEGAPITIIEFSDFQ